MMFQALQLDVEVIVFGCNLSAAQMREISNTTELKVLDRTQLILDIFAQHAKTREGKLQVELAQLQYRLPRLAGRHSALSRLAGGIGGRGPGETKLEIDRRRVKDRINLLEKKINGLAKHRDLQRRRRRRSEVPVVGIVGYTNAGKSTLLNALTGSDVLVENKLFATLDPTTRRLRFPEEREIVLADTVGFIRDLPPELIRAFRATLEELGEAHLLLHVVDVSDPAAEEHMMAVMKTLCELGIQETPVQLILNKSDRPHDEDMAGMYRKREDALCVSALDSRTLVPLVRSIGARLFDRAGEKTSPLPSVREHFERAKKPEWSPI
jgi:GTP-binding protein HflX